MAARYVVTGLNGQVVSALVERAGIRAGVEILPIGRPDLDLANMDSIEKALSAARPDVIISAAAYTAVDQAEDDEAAAFAVNAVAVGEIGKVAKKLGVPVVHLSTDYVFDGEKATPYGETDPVNPLGVYGRSKLEGERLLATVCDDYAILRTAWVYSPIGKNFLRTMLRLAQDRDALNVVADQYGNPTSALDIADAVLLVGRNLLASRDADLRGIFHMAGSGEASWADFATEIFRVSGAEGGPVAKVAPIPSSDYPTPASRPKNSRLNCGKLASIHNVRLPDWKSSTLTVVSRLLSSRSF
ncbi:MAG TPA: dTDP-4-dehydrorhamnose reductase [Rhizobium sp.]|nr:dTDP-4-dehydrorhamnose reductase [Rhizobium sp.]